MESGRQLGRTQSRITLEGLNKMGDELVRLCDGIERHGLVDYQYGVWEEQITEGKYLNIPIKPLTRPADSGQNSPARVLRAIQRNRRWCTSPKLQPISLRTHASCPPMSSASTRSAFSAPGLFGYVPSFLLFLAIKITKRHPAVDRLPHTVLHRVIGETSSCDASMGILEVGFSFSFGFGFGGFGGLLREGRVKRFGERGRRRRRFGDRYPL